MVVHLDQLAPYQGTARDERHYGGSSESSWRVITVRTKQQGRKVRLITDVTSKTLRNEEIVVHL
jgi:uncharacterized membrane protein YgaE (UPF0421/DUF939 family)